MGIWEIIVGIVVLILSIVMIILIILQEGHQAGLGTVTGGADSFLSRGKARTADAIFARVTKYCAITFFVLVILLNALSFFGIAGDKVDDDSSAESSAVSEVSDTSEEDGESTDAEKSKDESAADDESKSDGSADDESTDGDGSDEESAAVESDNDESSEDYEEPSNVDELSEDEE